MQLTIDSNESLGRVLEVVGSLYGVHLSVVDAQVPAPSRATARTPARGSRRGSTRKPKRAAGRSTTTDLPAVRSWGRANGYQVSDRGRVSTAVLQAYQQRSASSS
jgi:hypothetical protein